MNDTQLPISNSVTSDHLISLMKNADISIFQRFRNLSSMQQCIADDIDELHHEFLITDDKC